MKPLKTYACYNVDEQIRIESSSGAAFTAIAEYVIDNNGIVYGVAMSDDCYYANFISVNKKEDLGKLRGSKYLQAKIGNAFKDVKSNLIDNKIVLFTGTACQINGLKLFLGKDYENLICIDVICHGVPSPALWKKYVEYKEKTYNSKLESVNFRCKDLGWVNYGLKENENYISKNDDEFMQMFLRNHSLRPSCYECNSKINKMSDITLGDFWGIDNFDKSMNDNKGCSLLLIRTKKGIELFENIRNSFVVKEFTYEEGVKYNPSEYVSTTRSKERQLFFNDMNNLSFNELSQKYAAPIKSSMKSKLKKAAKLLLKM